MEDLFNKPILDQMYEFRKEFFEQKLYDENPDVKKIEHELCDIFDELDNYLKKIIKNEKDYNKVSELIKKYDFKQCDILDLWNCIYFKLGITERDELRKAFISNKLDNDKDETYFNSIFNDMNEWLEEQKRKYTFGTKEYKELQKRYNDISEKYPNVIEVYEDLKPIALNKEEIKALVKLREIDIAMSNLEIKLCFKLGMKEVINF